MKKDPLRMKKKKEKIGQHARKENQREGGKQPV